MASSHFTDDLPESTQVQSYESFCTTMYETDTKALQKRLMCLLYSTQLTLESTTAEKSTAKIIALSYLGILKLSGNSYLFSEDPANLEFEIQKCLVILKSTTAEFEYSPLPGFLYSMSWEQYIDKNINKYTPSDFMKIYRHFKTIIKDVKGKTCTIETNLTEDFTVLEYQEIVSSARQLASSLGSQKQLASLKGAKPKTELHLKPKTTPRTEKVESTTKSQRITGGLDQCEEKCKDKRSDKVREERDNISPKPKELANPSTSIRQLNLPPCDAPILNLVSILDKSQVLTVMKTRWVPTQIRQYQDLYQKESWDECWSYIDKECAYEMVHRFVAPVMNVTASQNDVAKITSLLKSLVHENVFGSMQSSIESSMILLNETLKTFRSEVIEHTQGRLVNVPVSITPPQVTHNIGVQQTIQPPTQKKTITLSELLARKRN